jgi:hypothetical protein
MSPSSRSDNSRSRPWRASNHGRASIAPQNSSHDEAMQRPSQVWARQPLVVQRSGHGHLLGYNAREASDEVGASGLRAHQRHAHFDLGRSNEFDRMPQHLFSAVDAYGDSEYYDQVEQHGAKSPRDNAVSMESRESTTVNRDHEGRARYSAQATRTHDSQAEPPRSTSPGLQVKANGVRQTLRTSSEVQQHVPGPRQSSLFQFYARKSDRIAGNSIHENSHNKVHQMDGSQLLPDETTSTTGALPNAVTPGRKRRGSGCEILARESEIDDEMSDGGGEFYEDAEDKPASSALGKRKAKAGRVSKCDSSHAQGLKRTEPRAARQGGSASTAKVQFTAERETTKRNRPIEPCHPGKHAEVVYGEEGCQKTRSRKRCQYPEGCDKSAIGGTLFCIAHGGGKRCQYPEGCSKGAKGSTMFCIAHGGGKRCQYPDGCDKSTQRSTMFCIAHGGGRRCQNPEGCGKGAEGSTMFCNAHGGGRRCQYPEGCGKSAIGRTLFCKAHGGGKRCQYPEGCDKSAIGRTLFCKAHGGGKRCQYPEGCGKSAQGSTMFCKAHGGGKRCQYAEGCDKSAQGSTMFCRAHGGGKRCQHPEGCGKSALGSTMFCKAHGGGKRCEYPEGCDKSAQGSTMFCLAHGGGKRCQYPEGCDKSALGSTMFCTAHGGGKRCQYPDGCGKSARGSTMCCIAHGGGRRCSHESGCRKLVRRGGLCKSHGAEVGS